MLEIEVKIKIDDVLFVREKILSLGGKIHKDRYYEENVLYDFADEKLKQKNHALRLRNINKKSYLTFKGPEQKSRKFKIREEFETEVRNKKQIKNILKSLGLKPVVHYEKYRTVFKKHRIKIFLDELSVGNFLEIEGQRSDIVRFALSMGYSKKDFITKNYIQILQSK